jgi:NAD(P)H dehydrogenase (quinone)
MHQKALIISTTIFDERSYEGDLAMAMKISIDDFALRFPGVQSVEHVYFHAVHGASDSTRQAYLEKAHFLGKSF